MPSQLYWQSVQLTTLLVIVLISGLSLGCDANESAPPASSTSSDPVGDMGHMGHVGHVGHIARPGAGPAPIASIAELLGVDAGELESKTDPPSPAGDLASEVNAFTTIDACIESRARLDPLLGDALDAIGYETFLSDACRVLDATKAHDARRCAAIDASVLRERCEATVAEVAGQADACPWEFEERPREGRDPACVAIASHDGRLCAAVRQTKSRATCQAIAGHNPSVCEGLRAQTARNRCLRAATRWASTIARPQGTPPQLITSGTLTLSQPFADGAVTTLDLGPDLERGVVLVPSRDGIRFSVGHSEGSRADVIAPSPLARASFVVDLLVPSGDGPPLVEHAELLVAGHTPVSTPTAHSTLRAKMEKFDPTRAGALTFVVDGELVDSASSWRIHAELSTFVRDKVRAGEALEATIH